MDEKKPNLEAHHEAHQNKAALEMLQKTLENLVETQKNLVETQKTLVETFSSKKENDKINACIEVHQKALDDLVNVNSLFTIAVFVGLAYANPKQQSLENRPECDPDTGLGKRLIIYEVNSFACFLFSSLVAKAIKVLLNIRKKELTRDQQKKYRFRGFLLWCKKILLSEKWKRFSLGLAVLASFAGIVLLTLSIVYVIQIRVGKLTCGSHHAIQAVAPLCVVVFSALLFYVPSMAYSVIVTASEIKKHSEDDKENSEDIKASNGSEIPKLAPENVNRRCFECGVVTPGSQV